MADAAGRAIALVARQGTTTGQALFAARVQEVLAQYQDIASEACWQAMAQLVAQEWVTLSQDQAPVQTWGMLSRCAETVLKLRRVARGSQQGSADDALTEFRRMMADIAGDDDEV